MRFSAAIANGGFIQENQRKDFEKYIRKRKQGLVDIAEYYNQTALEYKGQIKDIEKYRERYTFHLVIKSLNYYVFTATQGKYN